GENSIQLPAAEHRVRDAAAVQETLAVAHGKLVRIAGDKALANVVVRVAFLGAAIEGVLDARAAEVEQRLGIVEEMAPGVCGQECQSAGESLFQLELESVIRGVGEG